MTESWAIGIPTIATNNFGMQELVKTFLPQHTDKMLFNLGDAKDLSHKIYYLYSNPEQYNIISNECYLVIDKSLNKIQFKHELLEIVSKVLK